MIVVDASLATKWLLNEDDSGEALRFLGAQSDTLVGPDLLLVEVASAVVRRGNESKPFREDAVRTLKKWTTVVAPLLGESYPTTLDRLDAASHLAFRLGHPLKDCIYLALAIEFDAELATCDARFATKARTVWPRVRLLADYASA